MATQKIPTFFDDEDFRIRRVGSNAYIKKNYRQDFFNKQVNRINIWQDYYSKSSSGQKLKLKSVVVKNLKNHDTKGTFNSLAYIEKNSFDGVLIDDWGNEVTAKDIFNSWKKDFDKKPNSKESWHLMFSLDKDDRNNNLRGLKEAVIDTINYCLPNHKYAYALHTHQGSTHIHIILNKRDNFTNRKIHFKDKKEIANFFDYMRDVFCENLAEQGFKGYINNNAFFRDYKKELERAEQTLDISLQTKEKTIEILESTKTFYNRKKDTQQLKDEGLDEIILRNYENVKEVEKKYDVEKEKEKEIMEKILLQKQNYNELLALFKQYKKKKNKKYFALGKELKMEYAKMQNLFKQKAQVKKEMSKLETEIERINLTISSISNEQENNYRILNTFCNSFNKYYKKKATKAQVQNYIRIRNELDDLEKQNETILKSSVESSLIYSKVFGKQENFFNMIKKSKSLENSENLLKNSTLSDLEKQDYQEQIEKSKQLFNSLMQQRFDTIFKELREKEKKDELDKEAFIYKEYLKAIDYYDKPNDFIKRAQNQQAEQKQTFIKRNIQNHNYTKENSNAWER